MITERITHLAGLNEATADDWVEEAYKVIADMKKKDVELNEAIAEIENAIHTSDKYQAKKHIADIKAEHKKMKAALERIDQILDWL